MKRSRPGTTPWIVTPEANPAARLRLLCVPHAGAGASVYALWRRALPAEIEVCAIQMPGRESRLDEPPLTRWDDAIEGMTEALLSWIDRPFALFGHSLGAILAFELARRLRREPACGADRLFRRLIVSGCRAPHLPLDEPRIHDLPPREFVEALRQSMGTPPEVLDCAELLDHFIPVLRADLCLYETYFYRDEQPLAVPIAAFGGLQDEQAKVAAVEEWREHTAATFRQSMFRGGHFFLKEHRAEVLAALARELRATLASMD